MLGCPSLYILFQVSISGFNHHLQIFISSVAF